MDYKNLLLLKGFNLNVYDEARIEELGLYIIKELYIVKYFPLRNILQIEFIEVEK